MGASLSMVSPVQTLRFRQPVEERLEVRSAIQRIAPEHRHRYGYRQITAELHRRGMHVNHNRVLPRLG